MNVVFIGLSKTKYMHSASFLSDKRFRKAPKRYSKDYTATIHSVENIISSIKEGEIAIPEIQRPFVWDGSKVRDLMDSLYKGFPVGYIIVWKNPDIRLKNGKVSSGKKILIDGQQRITAIEAAVVGQEVLIQRTRRNVLSSPSTQSKKCLKSGIQLSGKTANGSQISP